LQVRAFKSELSHLAQRLEMRPINVPERRSFKQITRAWAEAVSGAAARLTRQPPPPNGNGGGSSTSAPPERRERAPVAVPLSSSLFAAAQDPSVPLEGDDPSFRIYEDRAAADRAHAEMRRGPPR